jgi:hypothetical protein
MDGVYYVLRVQYKITYINRYFKGVDDRQMTQRGYPNFNSYIKNLHFLVFQTDRQTETLIWGGAGYPNWFLHLYATNLMREQA